VEGKGDYFSVGAKRHPKKQQSCGFSLCRDDLVGDGEQALIQHWAHGVDLPPAIWFGSDLHVHTDTRKFHPPGVRDREEES
jgi:hypothetical protein